MEDGSMDALEALKTRRSVRKYADKPIPKNILEEIVDCARLAATAINIQPWEFVVVTDKAKLKEIAEATDHGRFIADAGACVVILSKETKYYLEDCSAATQNVLVAARALGLGSCWVAGDKKAYAETVPGMIGCGDDLKLVSLIPLGYADEPQEKAKRPLSEVLHWETL
jgi:nitroreductase